MVDEIRETFSARLRASAKTLLVSAKAEIAAARNPTAGTAILQDRLTVTLLKDEIGRLF